MADRSAIEWTDSTFNPWIGCTKVSPACDHCYAEVSTPSRTRGVEWGAGKPRQLTSAANWKMPQRWSTQPFAQCSNCGWRGEERDAFRGLAKASNGICPGCAALETIMPARRRVFCASLADVFDREVESLWRDNLATVILNTPNLDWLLLTKRIGNAGRMLCEMFLDGTPPNVWVGATICNQAEADRDVPKLLRVPAAVRFLSIEPMLGPIDLRWLITEPTGNTRTHHGKRQMELRSTGLLHWVIAGGESGSHARPSHPDWLRSLRDQCAAAGVPFLFKQWGEWANREAAALEIDRCYEESRIGGWVEPDGRWSAGEDAAPQAQGAAHVFRIGKKAAGRLLDGAQHDGYPEVVLADC